MTTKTQMEDGLQAWAQATAGVPAIWVRQANKIPTPGLSLHLDGPRSLSAVPELSHAPAPAEPPPQAGQEIIHSAREVQAWSLQVQARSAAASGEADATALLLALRGSLRLQGTIATLRAAGVTVASVGDVQDVSAVIETGWQDRASMTLLLWAADVSTERSTFIETVEGQGEGGLAPTTI